MRLIKFLCTMVLVLTFAFSANAQVINNSPTAQNSSDSLPMAFYALDSAGTNPVALASGDSVFLAVSGPSGAVVFKDSLAFDGVNITSQTLSSYTFYTWAEAGSVLDGSGARDGAYSYVIAAKDKTGAALCTPILGTFQLYTGRDYNEALNLASDTSFIRKIIDSLGYAQGVIINAFSFEIETADVDSLFYGTGNDTLWIKVVTNKRTGNYSTKVVSYSDR